MKKKNPNPLIKVLLYVFLYFFALGLALNQYYRGYWLIAYRQVLTIVACIFGVLLAAGFMVFYWQKLLFRRHNRFSSFFSVIIFSGIGAFLVSCLFLGIVPFVNEHVGHPETLVLDVVLMNKERYTGRGGANPVFYYTFFDDKDSSGYVLMSPYNINFKTSVHLRLQQGCLGILYAR